MNHLIAVKFYKNIKDRGIGLIGKNKAFPVLFNTRFGIHTLGLKFPIDVLILDDNYRVVKIKNNLFPNRFLIWPLAYQWVLELPAGYVKKNKIKLGENCKFNSNYK